jgi:uncharacterized SAM-binding protein YcdF (DUF218 family)
MLMLLRLKTLLKMLVLPPGGPLLLALFGLLLLNRWPRLARVCLTLAVLSLWLLSTPLVANVLARMTEHYPAVDLERASSAQAIVILGGGGQRDFAPEYGGPAAEPIMLERLSYGAYLARKTGLPVLVTGYHLEAHVMSETLQRIFGVTPRWIDDAAYDTFQNAANTARILKLDHVERILLVTHSTHMWRAAHEFRDAGMQIIPAPTGMRAEALLGPLTLVPAPDALLRSHVALYELLGEPVRWFLAETGLRHH